jgi:hypothetical protein
MSKHFIALSVALTLSGVISGVTFAADTGYEQDGYDKGKPSIDIKKTDIDITKSDNDVTVKKDVDITNNYNDFDVKKTDIDITKNDNDVTVKKNTDIKKTDIDITKNDNDVTTTKDVDITKNDNDVTIKKDTDIKKTDIDIKKYDNDVSIKKTDIDIKKDDFSQSSKGDQSPNINKSTLKNNDFVDQKTSGAASPNLYDSTIKNSDLVGGNQDNSSWSHNKYDSTGQVNLTQSKADNINAADHYSTILDGDVDFGGGGYAPDAMLSKGGYGGASNINTGIAQNSVIGNASAQFTNVGIGINGEVGGGKSDGSNFNNSQNQTLNFVGGSN